jgi:hypothetical protein
VLVAGAGGAPAAVEVREAGAAAPRSAAFSYDAAADVITIKKPDVKVAYEWTITIVF